MIWSLDAFLIWSCKMLRCLVHRVEKGLDFLHLNQTEDLLMILRALRFGFLPAGICQEPNSFLLSFMIRSPKSFLVQGFLRKIPKSVPPAVGLAVQASVPLLKLTDVDSEMEAGLCHDVPRLAPGPLAFTLVLWEKPIDHRELAANKRDGRECLPRSRGDTAPKESETRAARKIMWKYVKFVAAPHAWHQWLLNTLQLCFSYFMDLPSIRLRRAYSTHSRAWEVDFCVNNELGVRNSLLLNTCAAAIFDNRNSWNGTLKRFETT